MQIKGEKFIKNVQLQQEKEELEQKLNELNESKQNYIQEEPEIIKETVSNEHELNNIMLDSNDLSNENDNKKKYLILGIILVVLFLLTIIIIRLLTNDDKKDSFTSSKVNSKEMKKIEESSNIEENFQKIINERIKKDTQPPKDSSINTPKKEIKKVENNSIIDNTLDETIKKIEQKTKEIKKEEIKVIKKVETKPKKSVKTLIKDTNKSSISTNSIKGYFVQIGAFRKTPSSSYINKIRNANLKYKIYRVEVKGTMYNKVLIGPYSSRAIANQNISTIKNKLNLSSAYVLKF